MRVSIKYAVVVRKCKVLRVMSCKGYNVIIGTIALYQDYMYVKEWL